MWTEKLKEGFIDLIGSVYPDQVGISQVRPVGGGCINESFRVETSLGVFFMKWNDAGRYPGMFSSEARGLRHLREALCAKQDEMGTKVTEAALDVPLVVVQGEPEPFSMLVLDFIEAGEKTPDFWESFGRGLAYMHRHTNKQFGLDHSNYIGSLPQSNRFQNSWIDFFVAERLEAQVKLAMDNRQADRDLARGISNLYPFLNDFFPEEPPALLHGDLWSGNFLINSHGRPCIVDPAVYFGHRYMDLGMTRLFGGFSEPFYQTYHTYYPLEKNWREGTEIANLYPLLVHLNLFGGAYLTGILDVLKRFR